MLNEFLELLGQADAVLVGTSGAVATSVTTAKQVGEPSNQVALLTVDADLQVKLTEECVASGRFDRDSATFMFIDADGEHVDVCLMKAKQPLRLAASVEEGKGPHFLVIQEGGSSQELYVQSLFTRAQAARYQASCGAEGAYRTSDVIEVSADLAEHPDFYRIAEQLARAVFSLENRG